MYFVHLPLIDQETLWEEKKAWHTEESDSNQTHL